MSRTDRFKRYAVSAPDGEHRRETLSLWHASFAAPYHLTNWGEAFSGFVRGELVAFVPHPFRVSLPERGASGRFDMAVDVAAPDPDFKRIIREAAIDASVPVTFEFNQYLPGDPEPQDVAYDGSFSQAAVVGSDCTLTTEGPDWMNQAFPRGRYLSDLYRGLLR